MSQPDVKISSPMHRGPSQPRMPAAATTLPPYGMVASWSTDLPEYPRYEIGRRSPTKGYRPSSSARKQRGPEGAKSSRSLDAVPVPRKTFESMSRLDLVVFTKTLKACPKPTEKKRRRKHPTSLLAGRPRCERACKRRVMSVRSGQTVVR